MPALVSDIVDHAIVMLSQVPGVSTQVYAADRLLQYVQDAFDIAFEEHWWSVYQSYLTASLDGSTGHLTSDLTPTSPVSSPTTSITDYKNIGDVWYSTDSRPVPELPPRINISQLSGDRPTYRLADYTFANRPILFYPLTATGSVTLSVRQEPVHPFALTDTVYLDAMMLAYGAAFLFSSDDGTNPTQVTKFQSMFKQRMDKMISADNSGSLLLDDRWGSEIGDIADVAAATNWNLYPDVASLPTVQPTASGVLWNNNGVLSIS